MDAGGEERKKGGYFLFAIDLYESEPEVDLLPPPLLFDEPTLNDPRYHLAWARRAYSCAPSVWLLGLLTTVNLL